MIPARQPQQEYIIFGFALNEVVAHLKAAKMYDTAELMLVETRPHTSAPAPAPTCDAKVCRSVINAHREEASTEAAKAAREQVLDEIEEMIKQKWEFMFGVLPYNTEISKDSLFKMLKSLRQQGPQQ